MQCHHLTLNTFYTFLLWCIYMTGVSTLCIFHPQSAPAISGISIKEVAQSVCLYVMVFMHHEQKFSPLRCVRYYSINLISFKIFLLSVVFGIIQLIQLGQPVIACPSFLETFCCQLNFPQINSIPTSTVDNVVFAQF